MPSKTFIDSNIIVYTMDENAGVKRDRAKDRLRELTDAGGGVISTQVLLETFRAATRKLGRPPLVVRSDLQLLDIFETVTITPEMVFEAIDCSVLNGLSIWDSLIVAAAVNAQCDTLWSEDMNAGQVVLGVRIVNPLAGPSEEAGGTE